MARLPLGWKECKLGDFVSLKNGYAFKSDDYKKEGIPVIRISDIQDGVVKIDEAVRVDEENSKDGFYVNKGDVLVAMSGATTGKIGRFISDEIALQNQRVGNFIPKDEKISRSFIYYWVSNHKKDIEELAYGGAQPNISSKLIEEIATRLPPLPEQKRIVAKLDALFGHLDQLKARLENIPSLLKQFRQAVLTQAVTGKLTEEWRIKNPNFQAASLIEEIKSERSNLIKSKKWSKTVSGKVDAGYLEILDEIPKSWSLVKWQDVGLSQNGKSFSSVHYKQNGFKLLRPGNLHVSGRLIWNTENTKYLPVQFSLDNPDYIIGPNEIVMNLTAQSLKDEFLGRVCLTTTGDECLLNQRLARIVPVGFNVQYCLLLLKSSLFRKFVDELNTGTLIQHMFTSQLDQFEFPFPPVEEQIEIVRRVECLFRLADRIEAGYKTLQEKIGQLPQAILAKAFRGELALHHRKLLI